MTAPFSRFTLMTTAGWTALFGALWAAHHTSALSGLPGRLSYSISFLLLVALIIASALKAGASPHSLKAGALSAVVAGLGIYTAIALLPAGSNLLAYLGGGLVLIGGLWLTASLGHEVISRTYLWPLTIVVVGMDSWSVWSASGISHQMAQQVHVAEQFNFMLLTIHIPGVGLEPILGMGDVLFLGFMSGAIHHLELSIRRFALGAAAGFILCLAALLVWATPLPALTFVAPAVMLALGAEAQTTRQEILTAFVFVAILAALKMLLLSAA